MKSERLSAVDMAFLCLENGAAPMHLGAVAVFDAPRAPRPSRVAALLGNRARHVPRLRQRVRAAWPPPGGAVWAEDPTFDVDNHIRIHRMRSAGPDDLAALSADLMAEPLDLTRPLWQLHVITGLGHGGFAIMAKLHHALCDAYGAIGLSRGLFDGPTRQESSAARPVPSPAPPTLSGTSLAGRLSRPDRLVGAAIRTATDAASQTLAVLGIASDVVGKLRLPPASPLRAAPSGARRVIMVKLGVHELQLIRRRHGGTTHDALLAVVSGALHEWMIARGHPVGRLRLRALIPTSQRRSSNQAGGNHLSGYLCHLPVGEPDPTRRLQAIRTTMDHNKAAGPRRGPGALPVLAGALPHAVHRLATPLAGHAAPWLFDLVITTVPVPGTPLRLGGAHLRELYPLAPLAHGHALSIALSTYRDSVHIGLHADRDALPDIDKLAEALPGAITDLYDTGRS